MRLTQKQKLEKTIKWLRKTFPGDAPVYTRKKIIKKACGTCNRLTNYFLILINPKFPYYIKMDTILHEWAHVLSWDTCKCEDHSDEWGRAYARIYRAWLKWDFGQGEK